MKTKKWRLVDFVLIALLAGAGIALKPLTSSLVHLISTPLMIPGGTLAGGLYMFWLIIARILTDRFGSATLVGLVQGIIIFLTGMPGSFGILTLMIYLLPGIVIDLCFLLRNKLVCPVLAGMLSNLAGVLVVNMTVLMVPDFVLLLTVIISLLSGFIGGLLAYIVGKMVKKRIKI